MVVIKRNNLKRNMIFTFSSAEVYFQANHISQRYRDIVFVFVRI